MGPILSRNVPKREPGDQSVKVLSLGGGDVVKAPPKTGMVYEVRFLGAGDKAVNLAR